MTAGSELIDHEFLNISEEDLFAHVKKHNIIYSGDLFRSLGVSANTIEDIRVCNLTKSWPNFIAKRFDKPLHNRAIGGSSLSDSSYRILSDLHYSKIKSDDLILVGVTSPLRWFQFLDTGKTVCSIMGHGYAGTISEEYYRQLEENFFNRYNILYNFYKELMFISNLSDTMNGRIKMCFTLGYEEQIKFIFKEDLQEAKFLDFYNFCSNLLQRHNFIDYENSLCNMAGKQTKKTHHVFGHPRIHFHEQFANILIENLEQMYSD